MLFFCSLPLFIEFRLFSRSIDFCCWMVEKMGWHKLKVKILKSETKNQKWMLLNKADSVSWSRQVLNLLGVTPSFACTFDEIISGITIIYVNRLSRQFSKFISNNELIADLSCGQIQKISRKGNLETKKMRSMFIHVPETQCNWKWPQHNC